MRIMRKSDDRESGQVVGAAILLPATFVVAFLVLQIFLWFQANNVAESSAAAAYSDSRTDDGTSLTGQQAGEDVLNHQQGTLKNATITVDRTPDTVTVTVKGSAPTPFPFWNGPEITKTVSGPTDRWVTR